MQDNHIIPPGSTIGVLGDGQLGKMIAIAAARLGYRVAVLGPGGRESPAGQVAYWAKAWSPKGEVPESLLNEFCKLSSVVLIEWENIPISLVQQIKAYGVPVRPKSGVLAIAQDRLSEKSCAEKLGIPVPRYRPITDSSLHLCGDMRIAEKDSVLKTCRNGYDGKGQIHIPRGGLIDQAWKKLGYVPCILEEKINFIYEMSVIVARSPQSAQVNGEAVPEMIAYGPFENTHEDGILRATRYPVKHVTALNALNHLNQVSAPVSAVRMAEKLATRLDVHGLLAVEFFVTPDGLALFNEMAPRPHNSGHLTIECSDTSQFEQYVRAACNLPFGSYRFHSSGEMLNLIGHEVKDWLTRASEPGVAIHLYGKGEARPGRKMGHVTKCYGL